MPSVVWTVLGCLAVAYYVVKILRRLFDDFRKPIMSWLQRRSRGRMEIRTNDGTVVATTDLSAEEIERVLRQVESPPRPEREDENPSG